MDCCQETHRRETHGRVLREHFGIAPESEQCVIALAGNPNVGKSTVFNALTGLHQHTGNWPGKTVDNAQGTFTYRQKPFLLVDLPGTYSILAHTVEEQIARDFICFGEPNATIVVLDATCLERNLNLALQVMEITPNVIVCINLMDEARKKDITINFSVLEKELGVPVVATAARKGEGLNTLRETLYQVSIGARKSNPRQLVYSPSIEEAVQGLLPNIQRLVDHKLNPRWVALRLLDGDKAFIESINRYLDFQPNWKLQEEAAAL
ncbi:FeoB small GTPase domain-containing protein [Sporomusa acidovorans]|uniref:Fe(2+) transporter FeoB n=1 Tax=Sporomusa acidovorans (strain ATCC 49682 / DSM 3132 / Mol) TaxID=1123286 RepID=A0ABZ3J554_SPOA4|nr:FeoB small GTPase domain-containing protein [Sporomusa acidovorans]OZC23961.1 ferrous iron transport protein B [Sporomusa acidovorans DSM 3132]SDF32246.1 Ferrous iron transport protein B [Sporomusa acidovorans]